jgi:hypothetical protein
MYSVVGKTNPDGTRDTKNIQEVHRTCIKTGKQDVLYEHPDYKKEKKRLKINEYKVDDHK